MKFKFFWIPPPHPEEALYLNFKYLTSDLVLGGKELFGNKFHKDRLKIIFGKIITIPHPSEKEGGGQNFKDKSVS